MAARDIKKDATQFLRTYRIHEGCVVPTLTLAEVTAAAAAAETTTEAASPQEKESQKTDPTPQTTPDGRPGTEAAR